MPHDARQSNRLSHALLFARNFLKHPTMLGSVIPSSRFLVNRVLGQVDWSRARVLVEYGPGVGTLTTEILRRLRPDGRLFVFEVNPDFVAHLRETVPDARLHVLHASAAEVESRLREHDALPADYVISGIPFSTLPEEVREAILRSTRDVLRADGRFLVYQFSSKVRPYLERIFARVERAREVRNFLPAVLFWCAP